MSDSKFIIAFFVLLAVGKTILIIQCLRSRDRSTLPPSSSNSSPYASMTNMETGPEVLVEDPMTQRLVLAGAAVDDRQQQPEMIDVIQVPPPAYTIKDEHLEFENDPPPPSFRDVIPSSSSSPLSPLSLYPPKPPRRKPSRPRNSGSQSNNSTHHQDRWSRHQLFRYRASTMDSSSSDNTSQDAAESGSCSGSRVRRPSATAAAVEPTILRIPNVARWVAESRRDVYQAIAESSSSSEPRSFGFVSTYSDSDTYSHHSESHGSSSTGNMRILPSMGALYPSVIVHM
ncbi:hypothetical protein BG015_011575 [Linnemannia schmuckeri]|uniref:Uncharacterized protein n=1 Tax=Linnemannia schmuckeri TaxID=64567 RepID=A0A9P5RSH4_9FUNG|nr:hypothetical protein BG015_011575 [Linnemannia schmuckeri]